MLFSLQALLGRVLSLFSLLLGVGVLGTLNFTLSAQESQPSTLQNQPLVSEQTTEAKTLFLQGLKLAKDGNCQGAIAEFEASLRLVERPNTLFNIAQCFEELFQYDQAVHFYEHYLRIAPESAADRRNVQSTMRLLNNLLGTIETKTNIASEVWIDDRVVGQSPGRFKIPGGTHQIEFRKEGYLPVKKQITVTAKTNIKIEANLKESQKRVEITQIKETKLSSTYFWTGAALTLTAASVGAGMGAKALTLRSEIQDRPSLDLQGRQSRIEEMNRFSLIADIMFGVSGGFALGTVILYFFTDWGDSTNPSKSNEDTANEENLDLRQGDTTTTQTSFHLHPFGNHQSAGIQVSGAF